MNIDLLNVLFGYYSYDKMVMVAGGYPVEASARGQAVLVCVFKKVCRNCIHWHSGRVYKNQTLKTRCRIYLSDSWGQ